MAALAVNELREGEAKSPRGEADAENLPGDAPERLQSDPEYDDMTTEALIDMRAKLGLPKKQKSELPLPSHLEPPVWDAESQTGVYSRTGETCCRQRIDTTGEDLLPCHFRLFPRRFLNSESPFTEHIDETLCRFLRARDYDVEKALELYSKAQEIRRELNADSVLRRRDPIEPVWQNGTPHYHYGHDKLGRPFYIEMSGRVKIGKLMPPKGFVERADFKTRHVIHMEYMARRIEHARKRHGAHVSQLSQIMDLQGLSYFGDSRGMTLFKDALEIDQNAYPEHLGNLFLINAPLMFRGMWAIIKNWVDPKTVSKFVVLGTDYTETLLKYIDASELPEEYGGKCKLKLPKVNFDLIPNLRPTEFSLQQLGLDPQEAARSELEDVTASHADIADEVQSSSGTTEL